MTEEEGRVPDGIVYKAVTLTDAGGRQHPIEAASPGQGFSPGEFFDVGRSPDGQFASYAVFMRAAGHDIGEVRFVSAKSCAPVRFVSVRDGSTVDMGRYEGWLKDSPHSVRILQNGHQYDPGLPIDEAKQANPNIPE